jgi:hypothetical protein
VAARVQGQGLASGLCGQFEAFCRLIRTAGTLRPWPEDSQNRRYLKHYLVVDDHRYWALGPEW